MQFKGLHERTLDPRLLQFLFTSWLSGSGWDFFCEPRHTTSGALRFIEGRRAPLLGLWLGIGIVATLATAEAGRDVLRWPPDGLSAGWMAIAAPMILTGFYRSFRIVTRRKELVLDVASNRAKAFETWPRKRAAECPLDQVQFVVFPVKLRGYRFVWRGHFLFALVGGVPFAIGTDRDDPSILIGKLNRLLAPMKPNVEQLEDQVVANTPW